MSTNNEKNLEEENISIPNNESLNSDNETRETQSIIDENDDLVESDLVEAEIVENEELEAEGSEELLESDKEKNMKKKTKILVEENKKLQDEVDAFKDKFLRTAAEYENFRKRTAKEKEVIYTDACADVLKELLPVLDNLERALSVEGSGEDLRVGVEMTVKLFNGAFDKLKVEVLPSDGAFDPNLHNAVMHVEDEQYGANEIVEVFQKGYKRANKVLRHSMVKVAN